MTQNSPNIGDRVRCKHTRTYEGVVTKVTNNGFYADICGESGYFDQPNYDVEILERAKPVWRDGDVARNPDLTGSQALRFRSDGRWYTWSGLTPAVMQDEYVLVMRDGRSV